ncbi:MAG: transglutaminase N-terminal domain-containing protein [Limisphaerales bacterium]
MIYRLTHRTVYEYSEPVTISHHAARLEPRAGTEQVLEEFQLVIEPEPAVRTARRDFFGNEVCVFSVQQLHRRLEISASARVRLEPALPPAAERAPAWDAVAARFRGVVAETELEAQQHLFDSPQVVCSVELESYAARSFPAGRPLLEGVRELTSRIHAEFAYEPGVTTVATPVAEVLERRRGVCQDFTHLALGCLRSLGLPARYVSGYVHTRRGPGTARLVGADATHAWFAVYCPGYGWVDYDPTNDLMPDFEHITLAVGRDFQDVSPVSGIIVGGGRHEVQVAVDIQPE